MSVRIRWVDVDPVRANGHRLSKAPISLKKISTWVQKPWVKSDPLGESRRSEKPIINNYLFDHGLVGTGFAT